MLKGMVILSVCIIYTVILFSWMAIMQGAIALFLTKGEKTVITKAIIYKKPDATAILKSSKSQSNTRHLLMTGQG